MDCAKQTVQIALPTAACGVIIGIVLRSGFATKISLLISRYGSQNILIALLSHNGRRYAVGNGAPHGGSISDWKYSVCLLSD